MTTELQFQCNRAPALVLAVLADMQRFAAVHPIIQRIVPLGGDRYRVHETVRFGPIPYSFTYPVELTVDHALSSIRIRATIQGLITMDMRFMVAPKGNGSRITETVEIRSPLPIKGYLLRLLREQHAQLFRNIDTLGE
jgi:carbon monoxide dehydrogenase subunit G